MIKSIGIVIASFVLGFCQPMAVQSNDVNDLTGGVVVPLLEELYTVDEIKAGSPLVINWMDESLSYSAFVPYDPDYYPECENAEHCILFRYGWWTNSGWKDQSSANRALVAHEYAHVISLQRKLSDKDYIKSVNRINEECLADAVASVVLARGGFRPSVTDDYNVAYQCESFWLDTYGESRAEEAKNLAIDLLDWASHRFDGPEIDTPAIVTDTAVRLEVQE